MVLKESFKKSLRVVCLLWSGTCLLVARTTSRRFDGSWYLSFGEFKGKLQEVLTCCVSFGVGTCLFVGRTASRRFDD